MSYNLFIAYDLMSPGQDYEAVHEVIKSLGKWHQFQFSLFYIHTDYPPAEVYSLVNAAMDINDRLAVIDAQAGIVSNYTAPLLEAINTLWNQKVA